jgi:putative transposase
MGDKDHSSARLRWARFRFSVIGSLLSDPPEHSLLQHRLEALAAKSWRHPTTGESVRMGVSTIERWYYTATSHPQDPVDALARKLPCHAGSFPSLNDVTRQVIRAQYRQHPRWSYKLHHDNLKALCEHQPELRPLPSYPSLCRFMKASAMVKQKRRQRHNKPGSQNHGEFEQREVRSYEAEYVNGLWHLDFHEGSRRVLRPDGQRVSAFLLGVLDDRSRLCCHLQWYLDETAEALIHGLIQAFLKRELPAALMTDNGSAMTCAETTEGLLRLGVVHETTLAYTPEQNGKQESFWGQVEGRLMAMLESEKHLTLELLNRATQAWVEQEYHRSIHSEIGTTPLDRYLNGKNVGRPSPDAETLKHAFRKQERRKQRRSDGTLTVMGVRFEIPSRYRTLLNPCVRFARWDLSSVDLVDERSDKLLCTLYPVDKHNNADGRRRVLLPVHQSQNEPPPAGIAPLLQKYLADYAATGLPPAYLPYQQHSSLQDPNDNDIEHNQEDKS